MTAKTNSSSVPIVVVCGPKKSGKTTLVEQLLAALRARGYRVGTVKHSAHKHLVDKPGTDSYRHRRAGAAATLFLTPEEAAFFTDAPEEPELLFRRLFADVDLILVEGLSQEPWPKVVLLPENDTDYLFSLAPETVAAVLTEVPADELHLAADVGIFRPGEVTRLTSFLEERFSLTAARRENEV